MNIKELIAVAAAGVIVCSGFAMAQRVPQEMGRDGTTGQRQHQQQRGDESTSQNRSVRGRWSPEAITVVGYDLDRDGRTDAWYQVTTYEYDRMRQDHARSGGRPMRGQVMGGIL